MSLPAIKLTTPEHYPKKPSLFPTITHCRIAAYSVEVPRLEEGKQAHADIWFEKGFVDTTTGKFIVCPGIEGINIILDEPDALTLLNREATVRKNFESTMEAWTRYILFHDLIDGTYKETD